MLSRPSLFSPLVVLYQCSSSNGELDYPPVLNFSPTCLVVCQKYHDDSVLILGSVTKSFPRRWHEKSNSTVSHSTATWYLSLATNAAKSAADGLTAEGTSSHSSSGSNSSIWGTAIVASNSSVWSTAVVASNGSFWGTVVVASNSYVFGIRQVNSADSESGNYISFSVSFAVSIELVQLFHHEIRIPTHSGRRFQYGVSRVCNGSKPIRQVQNK